jgi:hypothetical protein
MVLTNEELEKAFHSLETEVLELRAEQSRVHSELITAWKKTGFYKDSKIV